MSADQRYKRLRKYWIEASTHSLKTMYTLYRTKRYADCLFFAHLSLEKILKALVVQHTKNDAPFTHNLPLLAERASLILSKEEKRLLAHATEFNMRCRYPDMKLNFYKLATKSYTTFNQ